MDIPRGKSAYRKQDGILTISGDLVSLTWTPLPGTGPPVFSLKIENITNLQQTPLTAPKVVLKVVEKAEKEGETGRSYQFTFPSTSDGRADANAVKDILSRLIKAYQSKEDPWGVFKAVRGEKEGNAKPVKRRPAVEWVDDATLMADAKLQEELMANDEMLQKIYDGARQMKPPSVSDTLFNTQFWSTRTGLLRAYAIEKSQKRGAYNVLGHLKLVDEEVEVNGVKKTTTNLKITQHDIIAILQQYPIVCRLYVEKVPKEMTENEFWMKFFLSQLATRLKGERVKEGAQFVEPFDIYTEDSNYALAAGYGQPKPLLPHIIDLEGNEENQGGFKSGNKPEYREYRQGANQKTVRSLNSLSETMMVNVAPWDTAFDPAAVARQAAENAEQQNTDDIDASTIAAVSLRDLQGEKPVDRVVLRVKEQRMQQQGTGLDADAGEQSRVFAQQVPSEVLQSVQMDLSVFGDDDTDVANIDLHKEIGVDDDSESDGEEQQAKGPLRIGARAARRAAHQQLLDGLRKRQAEGYGDEDNDAEASPMGIQPVIAQRCYLTNATSMEFLRQFWQAFQYGHDPPGSGNTNTPASRDEMDYHAQALKKCYDRIQVLAEEAEEDRRKREEDLKKKYREHLRRTGAKPKGLKLPTGGKVAVEALFEPTMYGLRTALERYQASQATR